MTVRSTPSDRCVPSPASWIFLTTASTRSRDARGSMTTIIVSPPPKMPMGPARLHSSCRSPSHPIPPWTYVPKNKTPLTPQRGERCLTAPAVPPSFRPARAQADAFHETASEKRDSVSLGYGGVPAQPTELSFGARLPSPFPHLRAAAFSLIRGSLCAHPPTRHRRPSPRAGDRRAAPRDTGCGEC